MDTYDIGKLVDRLIGQDPQEILSALNGAAGAWPVKNKKLLEQLGYSDWDARRYSEFGKGAREFLFRGLTVKPSSVPPHDFVRLRPLMVDMIERGIAAANVKDWLASNPGTQ